MLSSLNSDFKESNEAKKSSQIDTSLKEALYPAESKPSRRLAWCSNIENKISVIDLTTRLKLRHATFDGVQLQFSRFCFSWTYVKEISNTNLLVSLSQAAGHCANIQMFDISQKGQAKKVYSFEEVLGNVGIGDITYNSQRSILGAIPVTGKIAYHLFKIDTNPSKFDGSVAKLCRKSKWHLENEPFNVNSISGLDFDPNGEVIATMQDNGKCVISNVNTSHYISHLDMEMMNKFDVWSRCRWSTNSGEPLLYIKYDTTQLNVLDAEKKTLTLKCPIQLESWGYTLWIDVCPSNGNLLLSGGYDEKIKVYDRRASQIVKTFNEIHSDFINCVRWSPNGEMIASTSKDKKVKLLDIKNEKIIYTGRNPNEGN